MHRQVAMYECVEEYTHIKECCYSSPVNMTCASACNKAILEGPNLGDWVKVRLGCDKPFPDVSCFYCLYNSN